MYIFKKRGERLDHHRSLEGSIPKRMVNATHHQWRSYQCLKSQVPLGGALVEGKGGMEACGTASGKQHFACMSTAALGSFQNGMFGEAGGVVGWLGGREQ